MSQREPDGPYVYQPKPPQADGRIYAIGGLPIGTNCTGLTRGEADAIVAVLKAQHPTWWKAEDVVCEHGHAMDVHCCNCHSGFIFDRYHECPAPPSPEGETP